VDDSDLPTLASIQLFSRQWSSTYPQVTQLTIQNQPQSANVTPGSSASFSVNAAANQPISYQWYFNGVPMPGRTSQTLLLSSVAYGDTGNYSVRVTAGCQAVNSTPATLTVSDLPGPAPSGMALIPAGSFTMGNCMDPNEGHPDELPLHAVYVSSFYMDKYDVTLALWQQVYNWAITHGYSFDRPGSGKAANHPV
jgi:formylglycine-generating enzyme required for sulfatase activity